MSVTEGRRVKSGMKSVFGFSTTSILDLLILVSICLFKHTNPDSTHGARNFRREIEEGGNADSD